MNCTRRVFLTTTAILLASGAKVSASTQAVAFIVLQDIPPTWQTEDISKVIEQFRTNRVPAMIVALHYNDGSIDDVEAEKLLVSEYTDKELLEVVPIAPSLLQEQRYWHLRAANKFKSAISKPEHNESVPEIQVSAVTYFEHVSVPPSDLSAYRSAGFRVRIVCPDASTEASVLPDGRDQLTIAGGQLLDLFAPGFGAALDAVPAGAAVTVLHLSMANGGDLAGAALSQACETAAAQVAAALRRLGLHATLARDYYLLGGTPVPRDIALLLDEPDAEGHIAAFAEGLTSRGIGFSQLTSSPGPADCTTDPRTPDALLASCIVVSDTAFDPGSAASVVIGAGEANGLEADVRMHFGTLAAEAAQRLDRLTLDESDRVLRIGVADVASPPLRARLWRHLQDGQNLGHVRLHDVPGLRDRVMVSDPIIRRYWSLRRRRLSDPPQTARLHTAERSRLLEDAALAWSYFERHIYPKTGLVAGTVSAAPGGRVNSEITLWDVASEINALIAASDLGLIEHTFAAQTIAQAVASLPADRLGKSVLPPSNFSAQSLRTTVSGFDSCDAGRLGIALASAVSKGFIPRADVLSVLKAWTLGDAIRTGWHFSNRSGSWQDTSQSHCTDYIVPGFAFFGQTVLPLASWPDASPETEITTLYHAAALGAISTEPFALHALESGMDGPTRLILDALFDAQLGWFENTGQLRCVSETPIDRAPWFVYSGLKLDVEGAEAWFSGTITRHTDLNTDDIASGVDIISAKAAYLWQAVHPHPYHDRLVSIIRENARIPGEGFSVGVYSDTLKPVPNYTDVNTNGIILAAIAHILAQG